MWHEGQQLSTGVREAVREVGKAVGRVWAARLALCPSQSQRSGTPPIWASSTEGLPSEVTFALCGNAKALAAPWKQEQAAWLCLHGEYPHGACRRSLCRRGLAVGGRVAWYLHFGVFKRIRDLGLKLIWC